RNNSDVGRYNIFAFPNKLNLDDRIGMVSVTFPQRNYVAVDTNPDSPVYDLSNPYRASYVMFHTATDGGQDVRLNYLADGVGRLPRRVDRLDALTVSATWINAAEDKGMQVVAAQGSPYVTVRYTGVRPVIQVGHGLRPRTDKDAFFNDVPGTKRYDDW